MGFKNFLKTIMLLVLAGGCASMSYPKSDHFDGSSFKNPGAPVDKSFFDFLKWQFTKQVTPWPEEVVNTAIPSIASNVEANQVVTTYINHATHLIQVKGVNLITDPLFSLRASPLSWIGPKRVRKPGVELADLPRIDVVLISHNHYDHMDKESIRQLSEKFDPLFIVPLANAEKLKEFGAKKIVELDWWQDTVVPGTDVHVFVVPAQHWSKRGAFDTNKALWGGFVLKTSSAKIFFAGDTGYSSHFTEIYKRFGAMDISMLPIGAYEPRWFMKEQHMNPAEAVQAHLDLHSKNTLGTHFGTFQLTDEGIDEPVKALSAELKLKNIEASQFQAPENGQTHNFIQ